jgi:hypothetical protein
MGAQICIFEDEKYRNFLPLTFVRPVYDLRCGIFTIREKIQKYYSVDKVILHTRKYLENLLKEENKGYDVNKYDADKILFLNGRLLPSSEIMQQINLEGKDEIFVSNGQITAAVLSKHLIQELLNNSKDDILSFEKLDFTRT